MYQEEAVLGLVALEQLQERVVMMVQVVKGMHHNIITMREMEIIHQVASQIMLVTLYSPLTPLKLPSPSIETEGITVS